MEYSDKFCDEDICSIHFSNALIILHYKLRMCPKLWIMYPHVIIISRDLCERYYAKLCRDCDCDTPPPAYIGVRRHDRFVWGLWYRDCDCDTPPPA